MPFARAAPSHATARVYVCNARVLLRRHGEQTRPRARRFWQGFTAPAPCRAAGAAAAGAGARPLCPWREGHEGRGRASGRPTGATGRGTAPRYLKPIGSTLLAQHVLLTRDVPSPLAPTITLARDGTTFTDSDQPSLQLHYGNPTLVSPECCQPGVVAPDVAVAAPRAVPHLVNHHLSGGPLARTFRPEPAHLRTYLGEAQPST